MPTLMATTSASRGSSGASLVSRVFVLALLAILAALYHHHSASSALSSASLRDLKASLTACAAREATLSDQREAAREHAKGIQRKCDEDSKQKSNIAQGDVARCQGDIRTLEETIRQFKRQMEEGDEKMRQLASDANDARAAEVMAKSQLEEARKRNAMLEKEVESTAAASADAAVVTPKAQSGDDGATPCLTSTADHDNAGMHVRLSRSRALVLSLLQHRTQHKKGRPFDGEYVAAASAAASLDARAATARTRPSSKRMCSAQYPSTVQHEAPVVDYVFVNDAPPPPPATVELSSTDKDAGKTPSKERRKDKRAEQSGEPRHPNATEAEVAYAHMAMISPLPATAAYRYILMYQTARVTEGGDDQCFYAQFSDKLTPPAGSDQNTIKSLWTRPAKLTDLRDHGCVWSPSLFLRDGHLWLFYAESTTCLRPASGSRPPRWSPGGNLKYVVSRDGLFWSKSTTIYEQWRHGGLPKVIANPPIETSTGRWILPYWTEAPRNVDGVPGCPLEGTEVHGVLVSKDRGRTWKSSESKQAADEDAGWLIEASAIENVNGTIVMFHRTQSGLLYATESTDESAMVWNKAIPTNLPNPNSKAHTTRLRDGRYVMCSNHHVNERTNLVVSVSSKSATGPYRIIAILEGSMKLSTKAASSKNKDKRDGASYAEKSLRQEMVTEERRRRRHLSQEVTPNDAPVPLLERVSIFQRADAFSEGNREIDMRYAYPTVMEDATCDGVVHIAYSVMPPKASAMTNMLFLTASHDQRGAETRDMGGIKVQTVSLGTIPSSNGR